MAKKIFVNIFFEKRNMLVLYIVIVTMFTMFLGVQSIFIGKQVEETLYPDIIVNGAMDEDGVMRYKLYNDIGNVPEEIERRLGDKVDTQSAVVRNLLTISDNFNNVEYRVYGMNDQDIEKLNKYIKSGKAPQSGKKEVLIGSYAARYYGFNIGDKLSMGITLNKDNMDSQEGEYTVSGILSDNIDYFKGSMIISKDSWCQENEQVEDNIILFYLGSDKEYKDTVDVISSLQDEAASMLNILNNYAGTSATKKSLTSSIVVICIVSMLVIILLFFFLMRGMVKKIGLLKALGLPEKSITKIFSGGLIMITIIAVAASILCEYGVVTYLNSEATKFYGFEVVEYSINKYAIISVLALNILNMLTATVTITWLGKRVSPRDAMVKS